MQTFQNLDLLTVGIAVAATVILGFTVYITSTKSVTNQTFFGFSLVTALWGTLNYISYQFSNPLLVLWLWRGVLFFAVFQSYFLYLLFAVFPKTTYHFSKLQRYILLPLVGLAAIITLSPFAFTGINGPVRAGTVAVVMTGPGIIIFAIIAIGLVLAALYQLILRLIKSKNSMRTALLILLGGIATMFVLIIFFNLIFSTLFHNPRFVPLGAIFTFPFIAAAAYVILRENLFNIKVIGTTILVFLLSIASFMEIIFSNTFVLVLFRISIFILVLVFGTSLIRGVLREVEQREHIEKLAKELEAVNERLKELDQLKSEFLSVASHQLRAPITAIRGYIANILEDSYGEVPPYLKDPLLVVQETSREMVSSIEDYLDVSRIEQGRMKYEIARVDITALAKRACEELKPLAEKKGLTLTFTDAPELTIDADLGKIKQVFSNIIDNCIKYTPNGSVTVSIEKDDEKHVVRFRTSDTGIGIAADELDKLFEKFTRARDANKVNTTGTGLGLYVAKSLVEGHHGTIKVTSEGLGKGSQFIVELPLTQPDQPLEKETQVPLLPQEAAGT